MNCISLNSNVEQYEAKTRCLRAMRGSLARLRRTVLQAANTPAPEADAWV